MTKCNHLGDAYARALARVKAQEGGRSRLGMEALMWVSNSERPLHTSELCHALGVTIGSPDLNIEDIPTIQTLLACSLGLITVDASSSTVLLVNSSLQEYLSNNPSLFQSPHSMIAEVCLTYLNFQCVRELSPTLSSAPQTLPLVGYASSYWGKHIRKEETESVTRGPLALGLLMEFEKHISSQLLLLHYDEDRYWWEPGFDKRGGPKGFTGLHGAAFFGITKAAVALLAMKEWDINTTDTMGRTALAWAAIRGHEGIVKILLQQKEVKADTTDIEYGRTPLLWATNGGHEGVVKLLLEREDINPNAADTKFAQTPLILAAEGGHEGVVKLLLERDDVNPDIPDLSGKTALQWASSYEDTRIVELLSAPKLSPPALVDTDIVLEHPSPDPSDLLQNPSLSIPSASLPWSNPFPSDTRPLLGIGIGSFMIIFSLAFLFSFLAAISLLLINHFITIILPPSFRG